MYYRMHASILKTLERTSGELNYTLIEEFLDTAEISPFVKGVSRKQNEKPIVKEEPGQGRYCKNFRRCFSPEDHL